MRKIFNIALCIFVLIALTSCSKNYREVMEEPEKLFYQGKFRQAAKVIYPLTKKKSNSRLLYMMESGYIYHAAGEYEKSNSILLEAADIAKVIPVSIGKQAASLLTNESVTNYRGEDYEKVLLHMYLGINFVMLGRYDEARVEFKAVNNELAKIKSENGQALYKQNIMAKYLTAITYEIMGEIDNDPEDLEFAYIEYQQIYKLDPDLEMVKTDLMRLAKKLDYKDDLKEWQKKFVAAQLPADDSGELIIIYQSGRCAIKKSRGKLLNDRTMKAGVIASFATGGPAAGVTIGAVMGTMNIAENPIPRIVRRSNTIEYISVRINDKTYRSRVLEDISGTAIKHMEDMYPLLAQKVAASVTVKAITSIAAGIAVKTAFGRKRSGLGSLFGALAGIGTGAALFSQMKPDLRCWHTLPEKLQLARIYLKEGSYDVVIEFMSKDGKIIEQKILKFTIEKGKKVFINERTLI